MGRTVLDKLFKVMDAAEEGKQANEKPKKDVLANAVVEEAVVIPDEQGQPQQRELPVEKKVNPVFQSRLQAYLDELTEEGREQLLFDYEISEKGIYRLLHNPKTGELGNKLLVSYTPVLITNVLVDVTTKLYLVELEFFLGGKWQRLEPIPKSKIGNSRGIVDLANYNLDVTCQNARLLVQYLQLLSHLVGTKEPMQLLSKLGWHDGVFNLPGREGENLRLQIKDEDLRAALKDVQGEELEWLHAYLRLCQESLAGRFVMACSFCAPLLELVDFRGSPLVLLYGEKGTGKTTIMRMAASFWGNEKLIYGFDGTINGFETHAGNMDGLPLFLDDVQQMSKGRDMDKFLQTLIYMLHNGRGKLRADKEANAAQVKRWHTMNIISSEQRMVSKTMTGGAGRRVLELELDQRLSKESLAYYNNLVARCHGCSKERYLRFLETFPRKKLQYYYDQMRDKLFALDGGRHEDTLVAMLALIVLADYLARFIMIYYRCVDLQKETSSKPCYDAHIDYSNILQSKEAPKEAAAADVPDAVDRELFSTDEAMLCCLLDSMGMGAEILESLPSTSNKTEAMGIYEGLIEMVNKYRKYFGYSQDGTTMNYTNSSFENYGFFHGEDVYIRPHVFAEFIEELGYRDSIRSIRKRLLAAGYITARKGGSTVTKNMSYNKLRTVERYVCLHMDRGEEQEAG